MDDHRQRAVERDAERLLEEITRMEFDVLDINGAWGAYPDPIAGTGIDAEPVVIRQKQPAVIVRERVTRQGHDENSAERDHSGFTGVPVINPGSHVHGASARGEVSARLYEDAKLLARKRAEAIDRRARELAAMDAEEAARARARLSGADERVRDGGLASERLYSQAFELEARREERRRREQEAAAATAAAAAPKLSRGSERLLEATAAARADLPVEERLAAAATAAREREAARLAQLTAAAEEAHRPTIDPRSASIVQRLAASGRFEPRVEERLLAYSKQPSHQHNQHNHHQQHQQPSHQHNHHNHHQQHQQQSDGPQRSSARLADSARGGAALDDGRLARPTAEQRAEATHAPALSEGSRRIVEARLHREGAIEERLQAAGEGRLRREAERRAAAERAAADATRPRMNERSEQIAARLRAPGAPAPRARTPPASSDLAELTHTPALSSLSRRLVLRMGRTGPVEERLRRAASAATRSREPPAHDPIVFGAPRAALAAPTAAAIPPPPPSLIPAGPPPLPPPASATASIAPAGGSPRAPSAASPRPEESPMLRTYRHLRPHTPRGSAVPATAARTAEGSPRSARALDRRAAARSLPTSPCAQLSARPELERAPSPSARSDSDLGPDLDCSADDQSRASADADDLAQWRPRSPDAEWAVEARRALLEPARARDAASRDAASTSPSAEASGERASGRASPARALPRSSPSRSPSWASEEGDSAGAAFGAARGDVGDDDGASGYWPGHLDGDVGASGYWPGSLDGAIRGHRASPHDERRVTERARESDGERDGESGVASPKRGEGPGLAAAFQRDAASREARAALESLASAQPSPAGGARGGGALAQAPAASRAPLSRDGDGGADAERAGLLRELHNAVALLEAQEAELVEARAAAATAATRAAEVKALAERCERAEAASAAAARATAAASDEAAQAEAASRASSVREAREAREARRHADELAGLLATATREQARLRSHLADVRGEVARRAAAPALRTAPPGWLAQHAGGQHAASPASRRDSRTASPNAARHDSAHARLQGPQQPRAAPGWRARGCGGGGESSSSGGDDDRDERAETGAYSERERRPARTRAHGWEGSAPLPQYQRHHERPQLESRAAQAREGAGGAAEAWTGSGREGARAERPGALRAAAFETAEDEMQRAAADARSRVVRAVRMAVAPGPRSELRSKDDATTHAHRHPTLEEERDGTHPRGRASSHRLGEAASASARDDLYGESSLARSHARAERADDERLGHARPSDWPPRRVESEAPGRRALGSESRNDGGDGGTRSMRYLDQRPRDESPSHSPRRSGYENSDGRSGRFEPRRNSAGYGARREQARDDDRDDGRHDDRYEDRRGSRRDADARAPPAPRTAAYEPWEAEPRESDSTPGARGHAPSQSRVVHKERSRAVEAVHDRPHSDRARSHPTRVLDPDLEYRNEQLARRVRELEEAELGRKMLSASRARL